MSESSVQLIVTNLGCANDGCSNQTGEPNSSPVDLRYNAIGIVAPVPQIKLRARANALHFIASLRCNLGVI